MTLSVIPKTANNPTITLDILLNIFDSELSKILSIKKDVKIIKGVYIKHQCLKTLYVDEFAKIAKTGVIVN